MFCLETVKRNRKKFFPVKRQLEREFRRRASRSPPRFVVPLLSGSGIGPGPPQADRILDPRPGFAGANARSPGSQNLLGPGTPPQPLPGGLPGLIRQNPLLGAATPAPPSTTKLFDPGPFGCAGGLSAGLQALDQEFPRPTAVPPLEALLLTTHLDPGRQMDQLDAGRNLVDVLASVAPRPDERFTQILLPDPQQRHSAFQRISGLIGIHPPVHRTNVSESAV